MPLTMRPSSLTTKALFVAGLVSALALAVTVIAGRDFLNAGPAPASPPDLIRLAVPPPASAGVSAPDRPTADVLRVTLRPDGIQPAEFEMARGRFLLVVYNKTGLADLALRLEGGLGSARQDVRLTRGHSRWRDMVNLPPGQYVLGVADRPDWSCRITVTGH
jgi:hypothetical protein